MCVWLCPNNIPCWYTYVQDKQTFISGLPSVVVRDNKDSALCKNLKDVLSGSKFYATCSKLLPDQEQDDGEVVKVGSK